MKTKGKGKERAYDKGFISIPTAGSDGSDVDDEDVEFYKEHIGAGAFLKSLDEKGISRCAKYRTTNFLKQTDLH